MSNDGRVILKISAKGIETAEICADTAQQQAAGHGLLAGVAVEMRSLDDALRAYRPPIREQANTAKQ